MNPLDPEIRDGIREFFEEHIPFNKLLGMKLGRLEPGFARLELPFRDEFIGDKFRPAIHGGVISALLDTCGGAAVFTCFDNIMDRTSTVDLRVDYLRPGRAETLVSEAHVQRIGNRVAVVEIRVFHPEDPENSVAVGRGVYNVVRRGKEDVDKPGSDG